VTRHEEKTAATKKKIIQAAIKEFGKKGIEGTSIETVASTAGYNKALIYRHFKNRETLYIEVIRHIIEVREQSLDRQPKALDELLSFWTESSAKHRDVIRLLMQEAIRFGENAIPFLKRQRDYYDRQKESLLGLRVPAMRDLNPKMALLAMISLTTFPFAFPQITKLVTGQNPMRGQFEKEWGEFLGNLLASR
jgi:AcrR family transcriptional regulator